MCIYMSLKRVKYLSTTFEFFAMFFAMFTNIFVTIHPLTKQVWMWEVIGRGAWTLMVYFAIYFFGHVITEKKKQ